MADVSDSLKAAHYYTYVKLYKKYVSGSFKSGFGTTSSGMSAGARADFYTYPDSDNEKGLFHISTQRTSGAHAGDDRYYSLPLHIVSLEVLQHNKFTQNNEKFFVNLDKLKKLPSKRKIKIVNFYFHTSIGSDLFRKNEPAAEPHTICIEFENGAIYGFKYWKDAYTNWLKVNNDRDITYDYWLNNGYSFDGKYYLNTRNYESITYKKYFIGKLEINPETGREEPVYFKQSIEKLEAEAYLYRNKLHPNNLSDISNLIAWYRKDDNGSYIYNPFIRQYVLKDPYSKTYWEVPMSVHADGLMRKAHRQMKENFKQTGIYETNIQRKKREAIEEGED